MHRQSTPWRHLAIVALAAAFAAPVAHAQVGTIGDSVSTKADEALKKFKRRKFAEAVKIYRELNQIDQDNLEYRLNLALCLYEVGVKGRKDDLEESRQIYEELLSKDSANIVAHIQSARIKARQAQSTGGNKDERERLLDEARSGLSDAARYGANSLRAIRNFPELQRVFKNDVQLQIDIIKAPQTPRTPDPPRDPFASPLPQISDIPVGPRIDEPVLPSGMSAEEQKKMVTQFKELVSEIDRLISANEYDKVAEVWLKIEGIMRQSDAIGAPAVQREFQQLRQRANEKRFLIKRLLLRAYYADGEEILNQMTVALTEQKHAQVFNLMARLENHAKQMTATEADFATTAAELLAEGKKLNDKAKVLEEIQSFTFNISGIVNGGGFAQAIVNGHVVSERDRVYGQDKLPIAGLTVVRIQRTKVYFRYKDTDFHRDLGAKAQ